MGKLLKKAVFPVLILLSFNAHALEAASCKFYAYELLSSGLVAQKPFLMPKHVRSIKDGLDPFGQPEILVRFNRAGAKIAAHYSERNIHKQLAIFCGNVELSRPYVQMRLTNLLSITYTEN